MQGNEERISPQRRIRRAKEREKAALDASIFCWFAFRIKNLTAKETAMRSVKRE
jgi:hypothetical protein